MADHDFGSVWSVLSTTSTPGASELTVARAGILADGREVLAGLDSLGNRYVLVPLLAPEQFGDLGAGRALQLRVVHLPRGRYASAVCTDRRLDDVFGQFARELLETVVTSGKPGRDMRIAYDRWRALFSERSGINLTKEAEIGLLGELFLLKELLERGGSCALWKGPQNAAHDFRSGPRHVEVKTTLGREGLFVSIHGAEQLAVPANEDLHVVVYRIEESDSGESLVSMIRAIEVLVDDMPLFESLLGATGFRWGHAHAYETKYRMVHSVAFDALSSDFPKIVPKSFVGGVVPPGTIDISYKVDLSGPAPTPLIPEARDAMVQAMASS